MTACQIRQLFARLLLLGAILLGILLALGWHPPIAAAAIRQLEEAPGQVVYQARQTLRDQHGQTWQAIAFKRLHPSGQASLELRLVGLPGQVEIDRSQALTLTNSFGKTLTAPDTSSSIFTDAAQPATNVRSNVEQYDLQAVLPQLQPELPLQLTLPIVDRGPVRLSVTPMFISEWQTLDDRA